VGELTGDAEEQNTRDEPANLEFRKPTARKRSLSLAASLLIAAVAGAFPLYRWQQTGEQRAHSLSNLRRLADAWQLYAQDWDACPALPVERRPDGSWLTWTRRLNPYGATPSILDNPANPVSSLPAAPRDTRRGFPVETSYALNTRFWNTFASGPFPADNLELPAQTALFVEAGPLSASALRSPKRPDESKGLALLEYGDTSDRIAGLFPYPSTHEDKLAVVAADGHATTLHVEHYTQKDGPHNSLYGRIGGSIYNWNGGHPNGAVDAPPQE
jgi:hypothetical protein